jgi:hypothetical protein
MRRLRRHSRRVPRRGAAASLEFILALSVAIPLVGIVVTYGVRIIRAVYDLICVWVAWPFL